MIDDRSAQATAYLSVAEVALALNRSAGHVRRLCAQRWSKQGLARQREGKWEIHPDVNPRLSNCKSATGRRDLSQVAELRQSGVHRKHIALAELKRNIVERFERFEGGKNKHKAFPQFVASLFAEESSHGTVFVASR